MIVFVTARAVGVPGNFDDGLVILNEEPELDSYYHANIIGGAGAFVMTTMDFHSYARAILAKLIREIAGPPVAALEP